MKTGDVVEMMSNLSKDLVELPEPRLGAVLNVNGYYVLVQPQGRDYVVDFLKNELKPYEASSEQLSNAGEIVLRYEKEQLNQLKIKFYKIGGQLGVKLNDLKKLIPVI